MTKEDFFNKNFIFDVYVLITKNINPFFLERKIHEQNTRDLIYMFWNECINDDFYKHTCKSKNFICLNGKNVLHPKASETLMEYVEEDEKNYGNIKKKTVLQKIDERKRKRKILAEKNKELRWKKKSEKK